MAGNDDRISRRRVVEGVATLGLLTAAIGRNAAIAQTKMSQQAAQYQDQPKNGQECAGCSLFEPPNGCKVVQGTISPQGWCSLFVKKPA